VALTAKWLKSHVYEVVLVAARHRGPGAGNVLRLSGSTRPLRQVGGRE
jgi:hypothetical protein